MCIVTEFIAGLLKFEFVFRRHIAGTEAEHVCDEYQSTNFLVILHDRSNEEEVVGFNVLAISAEELEVVISAKNVLAENDLRALFSNCGLENLTSLSNEEIQEITVRRQSGVLRHCDFAVSGLNSRLFHPSVRCNHSGAERRSTQHKDRLFIFLSFGLENKRSFCFRIACNTVNQTSNGFGARACCRQCAL